MMRAGTILTLTAVAMFGLSACNEAKSPETVQKDVASATDKAAENDAKAADKLANADASADKTVGDAQAKADEKITNHTLERAAVKPRKVQSRNCAYLLDKSVNCSRKILAEIKELPIG